MLDINWLILAYAGIFLAGLGVLILCISAAITLGTVKKSVVIATECVEDVTNIAEDALNLAKDLNETVKKVEENKAKASNLLNKFLKKDKVEEEK